MKNFMRTCGIIALFLFGFGLALTVAGVALGGVDKVSSVVREVTDGKFDLNLGENGNFRIQFGDASHESGESAAVRLPGCFAQRGKGRDVRPVRTFRQAVSFRMKLDPFRDIIRMTVLIESEPERNQIYVCLPASPDQVVQVGKIKIKFFDPVQ